MKISLVIEAETVEEFTAAIEAINTRPISVRMFTPPVVQEPGIALAAARQEQEQEQEQPPAATAPVVPSAPVEAQSPQTAPAEPAAAAAAPVEAKKSRGRGKKAEAAASPSTAANTTVSAPPVTQPTSSKGGRTATRDDLMKTFASYVQRYGTNYGYTDVSKMLTDTFGPGVRKSSDVTDDNLDQAVAVVAGAIEANPFGRKRADVN
jgi:hypothetical protein